MKFKTLKWIGLALVMTLTTGHAADSEYWREFEAKGIPLMQHIQELSNLEHATDDEIDHTKNALAYFFATGGKYGFREEPATESEYEILVKALAVTTAFHYFKEEQQPILDLVAVRRNYNLRTEDQSIQNHLIHAHAIIGYTISASTFHSCTSELQKQNPNFSWKDIKQDVQKIIVNQTFAIATQVYAGPLASMSSSTKSENDLLSLYINGVTLPLLKKIVSAHDKKAVDAIHQKDIDDIKAVLRLVFPQAAALQTTTTGKRLTKIVFSDGRSLERRADGAIVTSMFGFPLTNTGTFQYGDICLDGRWSDEQLINEMKKIGIAKVLYS
ncbi:hypothetical protein [Candidatus Finniella inopinata]|uniref:Uncharacterized protein n=1 Tax=Candidatus Finniella inopinata TaxID=1696036 RepID=A0A4V2E026_9PROT|nr:hypothetical protein [Candidatus Finniella inopinata]RZI47087.1 hypothetical protein EQU50_00430 [Candidatus Finniella inopinata]